MERITAPAEHSPMPAAMVTKSMNLLSDRQLDMFFSALAEERPATLTCTLMRLAIEWCDAVEREQLAERFNFDDDDSFNVMAASFNQICAQIEIDAILELLESARELAGDGANADNDKGDGPPESSTKSKKERAQYDAGYMSPYALSSGNGAINLDRCSLKNLQQVTFYYTQ